MSTDYQPERRRKLRIQGPISARVRKKDRDGRVFDFEATLDNLSAGGLYFRLARRVQHSAELSFKIHLPPGTSLDQQGMRIDASGIVRRIEHHAGDTCGLGVEFRRYRQIHI